jgi:hypothetical protein
MNQIIVDIMAGFLICMVSVLVTYFTTSISSRKNTETKIKEVIETHLLISHPQRVDDVVSMAIDKHANTCDGSRRLSRIEKACIYIIVKSGWSLEDAGLNNDA